MKSYDETVNTVFDRIHTYQAKKQKRTAITRRIAASCCAVSLLGGSVWYLNRHPMDTPIKGIANGDNTTTAKASDAGTTSPTTTKPTENRPLVIVDSEDTIPLPNAGENNDGFVWIESENGYIHKPISPALQEKMEQYRNDDVAYAVVVEILITNNDIDYFNNTSGFTETNEELIQLSEKLWQAYTAYVDAHPEDPTQKYSTVPAPEKLADYYAIRDEYLELLTELYGDVDEIKNKAVRSRMQETLAHLAYQDAMVEWRTFISTNDVITDEARLPYIMRISQTREDIKIYSHEYDSLRTQLRDEYTTTLQNERLLTLSAFCNAAPTVFTSNVVTGYYVELTAESINTLSEYGYYAFRMASPDGSVESDWHQDIFWND